MSIQQTIVEVANEAFARQNKEATVPTVDLIKMIEDGEKQLEGLFHRIKQGERENALLRDRVMSQRDTIGKLQMEVKKVASKRKKKA